MACAPLTSSPLRGGASPGLRALTAGIVFLSILLGPISRGGAAPERVLVRLPVRVSNITWLNDRTLLAATEAFSFTSSRITLVSLPAGEMTELAEGRCPAPSPDRTKVAFVPGPSAVGDIWILDLQTRERRRLTTQANARCARWSPDGRYLALVSTAGYQRDGIMIVAADTGRTEFVLAPSDEHLFAPAWYPDSRRLAFAASKMKTVTIGTSEMTIPDAAKQVDILDVRDRRRSTLLRLTESGGVADLTVSPEGQRLLLVWGTSINVVEGQSVKPIASGHSPAWHPTGSMIVYARAYDCTGGRCAGDDLFGFSF